MMPVPAWVKDAVFYQIFPDRFAMSEAVHKPSNLQKWGDPPTDSHFQGGDLLGIADHLDYLVDLGVNAIYLNPIFQSASNHRYHTHDYFRVDPLLGGDEALRTLVKKAHDYGIKIVLDGVFNHASRGFFQFSDILENGPASPWIDWFNVRDWPLSPYEMTKPANYESWWDLRQLPQLNTANPEVREFLMRVAEYWIEEFQVDGWRLDVPEEITAEGFWEEFRFRVKEINPDAYIVGEIWHEAPEWLLGDRFDALMNYPMCEAIIAFVAGDLVPPPLLEGRIIVPFPQITAEEFTRRLEHQFQLYDWEVTLAQLNVVDSHDTPRLKSMARGDTKSVELAAFLQMTLPGAPCIYYGDEISIQATTDYDSSFRDSNARWAFPWHDRSLWNNELLDFFKSAIKLRHRYPALRRGDFASVFARDLCCIYSRSYGDERLLVCLNSAETTVEVELDLVNVYPEDIVLTEVFGQPDNEHQVRNGRLELSVPARSGIVLAPTG